MSRIVIGLLAVYVATVLVLLALENRLVFHPAARWQEPPAGYAVRDIELTAADGTTIDARWFPCPLAQTAVLICHSRSGNLSLELSAAELVGWHRDIGSSVLIFDYPGYGHSGGRPSEGGFYEAAQAAYDWLVQVQGLAAPQILLYGRSLGSAVAVELASHNGYRALILVSPPTSLPDVAQREVPFVPTRWLMRNRFDSLSRIGRCRPPVFIIHGTCDRLVPFAQGEKLFAAASAPKQFLAVEGAHHGNCLTPAFFPALRRFLMSAEAAAAALEGVKAGAR